MTRCYTEPQHDAGLWTSYLGAFSQANFVEEAYSWLDTDDATC